jgi:YYY domain-containing protein
MDWSLVTDWLGREGGSVLSWWVLVTLGGAAVWPLLFRVLGGLPDRGYTLARTAGLMLTGFIFWFLGSLGLLKNDPAGMVFAWLVVVVIGWAAFLRWPDRPSVRDWFREHRLLILCTEVLFLLLLFGWAIFRAHEPEIASTEKPMEFMFLNSVRASDTFPPRDAWLSGYAISYYYFGYVIMAMLADLSGVSSGIAFGTMVALIFALAGIGAFGVVYNLVRFRNRHFEAGSVPAGLAAGVLGLCFLILMGNLGTALVDLPYRGYAPVDVGAGYFDFWDVGEREGTVQVAADPAGNPEYGPVDMNQDGVADWNEGAESIDRWGRWWWFRHSRVITDRKLDGSPEPTQPIAEFPQFSFILADLHPHVLALPFAVLAIGLALNLVLAGRSLLRWEYPLYAIWVGGMIFMNSWDAVYIPLLVGAEVLRRLLNNDSGRLTLDDLWGVLRFGLMLGGLTLVFYLPWIISFTSQASGILPNVVYPTPWQQYFLQFGTFLVIVSVFLLSEVLRSRGRFDWQAGIFGVTLTASLFVLLWAGRTLGVWSASERYVRTSVFSLPYNAADSLGDWLPDIFDKRLEALPSELLLLGFIYVVVGRLFARPAAAVTEQGDELNTESVPVRPGRIAPSSACALLLIGAAAVLTFAPDFVYLQDNFAVRINTVFKLYYQGWIMFSIAGAFAVWSVLAGGPDLAGKAKRGLFTNHPLVPVGGALFGVVVILLFTAGMLYPAYAIRGRALVDGQEIMNWNSRERLKQQIDDCEARNRQAERDGLATEVCSTLPPLTLNGAPRQVEQDEYAAIECLSDLEQDRDAVLIEAPCYCGYHPEVGRFSAHTGIPTLMGWGNHEGQWRGRQLPELIDTRVENGARRDRYSDAQDLYTSLDWARVWQVIDRYGIDYIVVGTAERNLVAQLAGEDESRLREYQMGLEKFEQVLLPVCQFGDTTVYRVAPE